MLKFDFSGSVGEVGGDIRKELPYVAPGKDYRQGRFIVQNYGKCSKVLYTKVSNKMAFANNADPDQTAPEGAV